MTIPRELGRIAALSCAWLGFAVEDARSQKLPPRTHAAGRRVRGSETLHRSLSVTAFSTSYHNPFLREPDTLGFGSNDVPSSQTISTVGGRISVLATEGRGGVELGVAFWRVRLDDFRHSLVNGDSVTYTDASVTVIQTDIIALGAPVRGLPSYAYGVLGLGMRRRSYTITESAFGAVDGARRRNEFQSSFGLGVRLTPIRQIAMVGELRWVPGAKEYLPIPEGGCLVITTYRQAAEPAGAVTAQVSRPQTPFCGTRRTYSRLASIGVSIALP